MNRFKKLLIFLLTLLIAFNTFGSFLFSVSAQKDENGENEAKFAPGQVIVGMKEGISGDADFVNFFPELKIEKVKNLTKVNPAARRQILCVTLAEKTEQTVTETMKILGENPHVEYAEPNFIGALDVVPNDLYFNAYFDDNAQVVGSSPTSSSKKPDPQSQKGAIEGLAFFLPKREALL